MKYSAVLSIVSMLVVGTMSAALAQSPDPFDIGLPTRSVANSDYWTDVLGPCYVPWYGPDYRHCGVRRRRSVGRVHDRAARPRGGVAYRPSAKGRVAAD